jgi:excisionase family DNA binding protein
VHGEAPPHFFLSPRPTLIRGIREKQSAKRPSQTQENLLISRREEGILAEKLLLNQGSAAKALGIGRSLLRELVREGRIEYVRVGRRAMFSRSALERFASNGKDE